MQKEGKAIMGFLNGGNEGKGKAPSFYLEIVDTPKQVRPLKAAPQTVWGHTIPETKTTGPDGKPVTVRRYSFELCTSTSRSGQGCQCCSIQDPLWHLLDQNTKVNKKGQRVDFPKKPIHLLPVLEIVTGEVKLLKGGNGTYKEMDAWYELQSEGQKNLGRCEWGIFKTGMGMKTNYHVVRSDATPFSPTPEQLAQAQNVMALAMKDMAPQSAEKFMQTISGDGYIPMAETPLPPPKLDTNNMVQGGPPQMQTEFTAAAGTTTLPVQPVPQAPPPVTTMSPPVSTSGTPTTNIIAEFTAWLNSQPEFQGVGILQNLVPILKNSIGDVNYHKCTPDQIMALRLALTTHLNTLRANKA